MDDWLLGLESFSLFGHQLGAQKPRASERASEPACLPSSSNKPTTQKSMQNRQARKTRAGDFGVLEDLRKSASSLSECVCLVRPLIFFLFFSHTFQTPVRLHQWFKKKKIGENWRNFDLPIHRFFHGKKMAQIRQISKGKFPNRQIFMISPSR
jgi:hypothetical protein